MNFKKYLVNISWLFLERLIQIISALVIGAWIARYLGPQQYGILSYAQSYAGIFATLTTLGLDAIVVKNLVKYKRLESKLLGTAFILKLISAIFVVGLIYSILLFSHKANITETLILIFASVNIIMSFGVIRFYFESQVKSKFIVKANIITVFLSVMVKLYLLLNQYSLLYFGSLILFDSFIRIALYIYYYQKDSKRFLNWSFSSKIAKILLKESWPIILSGIAISIYMKIDQVMIGDMLGNHEVGIYSAATKLSTFLYMIPVIINSSLFPAIINAKKISEELFNERMIMLYSLMIYISIGVSMFFLFASDYIIEFLYGVGYIESSEILKIHIWALLFVSLGVANSKWIIVNKLQKYSMISVWLGMLINIVLNYIMIDNLGILGAAYATVISQAMASVFLFFIFIKTRVATINMLKSFFAIKKLIVFIYEIRK